MKAYIKPNMVSFSVVSNDFMVASMEVGVTTPMGALYYCSNNGCKTDNPLTWSNYRSDTRDRNADFKKKSEVGRNEKWTKTWQYIGCYQYHSNGSGVTCETYYNALLCENTQWDLFINANGEYHFKECPTLH